MIKEARARHVRRKFLKQKRWEKEGAPREILPRELNVNRNKCQETAVTSEQVVRQEKWGRCRDSDLSRGAAESRRCQEKSDQEKVETSEKDVKRKVSRRKRRPDKEVAPERVASRKGCQEKRMSREMAFKRKM